MEKSELKLALDYFRNAQLKFQEALSRDLRKDSLYLDASIQRFEFTFEMSWKSLKRFLEAEGISIKSPKEAFKEAYRLGWLTEGDKFWTQMILDRNLTSHTYDQKIAMELYQRLGSYEKAFTRPLELLSKK